MLESLVFANHILHYHNVVDAFEHISVRHPSKPDVFIMSANMAPALVRSPNDFVEYRIDDALPANENAPRGFIERYIHSELYKRYASVMCVVHCHADEVLPYTVSEVPMKAMGHMTGFIGLEVPIFDISECYGPDDAHDLLVSNTRLGAALASKFSTTTMQDTSGNDEDSRPSHALVLMRQHGFTTWGRDIKETVYRAVYTTKNARLQTTSTLLRTAFETSLRNPGIGGEGGRQRNDPVQPLEALTELQARDTEAANMRAVERPWGLWVQEVKCHPLYTSKVE